MEKKEARFKWLGTVSAPAEYPAYPYDGRIIAKDFSYSFDHIWGVCGSSGWGEGSGIMNVSQELMMVPDSLEFTWLSVKENKFYTGKWALPHDKIYNLFKEGYTDYRTKRHETYDNFIIGLAPKGKVVVWLEGGGSFRVEVANLQAHDTILTRETVYEDFRYVFDEDFVERNLGYMLPETKERIKKYGYPDPNIYEVYREKYSLRPVLKISNMVRISNFSFAYYNGERETLLNDDYNKREYTPRARPKDFGLFWFDKEGEEYLVSVEEFDEKEIFKAFDILGDKEPIDFVVEIKDKNTTPRLYFTNKKETIEITNSKGLIFEQLPKDN